MEAPEIPPFSGPHLAGAARADTPFTVAGRQALATGWADSGVGEIWLYPFRALRRLTIAEAAPAHAARVTPAGFERRLEVDGREVVERVYVPANAAAIVLEWEVLPPRRVSDACLDPLDLELEWEVELEPRPADRAGRLAGLMRAPRPAPPAALAVPDGRAGSLAGAGRVGSATSGTGIPAMTAPGASEDGSWRAEVGARRLLLAREADADGTPGPAFSFEASRAVTYAAEAARSGPGIGAIRCLLGARLLASERLTLVVSATRGVPPENAGPATDPVRLVTARATDRQRRLSFGLTVSATDPLVGQALRWAGMRLPDFLAAVTGGPRLEVAAGYGPGARPRRSAVAALRVGLAALGAGDPRLAGEVAEIALRDAESARVDAEVEETGARRFLRAWAHPPAPGEVDAAAAGLLLHARYFLWTGDAGPIGAAWARLMEQARLLAPFLSETASTASRAGAPAVDPRVASAALDQLVLAAESLGHEAEAKPLRAAARTHAPADVAARAFSWAGGWGEWFEGATSEGFATWSALAAGGFHHGRAMWPGRAGPDDAASAAGVLCGIAYGMLGIEPDMPRSRLRLRPQLPESWELLALQGLRFGDIVVTLDFRRGGDVDRFEVEQVEGSTPLRLVLEAAVPGVITGIRVDGRPADLAPRPWGERTLVPVQLVLDGRRVLEVEHTPPLAGRGSPLSGDRR